MGDTAPRITGRGGDSESVLGEVGGLHRSRSLEKGCVSSGLLPQGPSVAALLCREGHVCQGVLELCSLCVCLSGLCVSKQSLFADLGTQLNSALRRNSLKVLGQLGCKQREVAPSLPSI